MEVEAWDAQKMSIPFMALEYNGRLKLLDDTHTHRLVSGEENQSEGDRECALEVFFCFASNLVTYIYIYIYLYIYSVLIRKF